MATQFDYDYSDDEMGTWIDERLRHLVDAAKTGVLFFNNHVRGQAPKNARRLLQLLEKAGVDPAWWTPPLRRMGVER